MTEPVPFGMNAVQVESALDMMEAVMNRLDESDIVIKSAAVADYRPVEAAQQKIKKKEQSLTVSLVKNPDILQAVGERKTHQIVVGFAAETERIDEYAMDKLNRKNCDLLVANDVTLPGAGFGTDTNIVRIYDKDGLIESLPLQSKTEVAFRLLELVHHKLSGAAVRKGAE
jgi:phosphopantothenoylcysteine decarboxylase/phosphopantothenate--cysteine ligase